MTKPGSETHAAHLFELVWSTLVDVLGMATTATLFRKAAKNTAMLKPNIKGLEGFAITRDGLEFCYTLPTCWQQDDVASVEALRFLLEAALYPLLTELTGTVVIALLERSPELRRQGDIPTNQA
ncbi:MAG: hypothetical protein H0U74_01245 [Bradymonadaceae bacterium]|nr:hypothetical protein [Lujinxingiaceae bacterium]